LEEYFTFLSLSELCPSLEEYFTFLSLSELCPSEHASIRSFSNVTCPGDAQPTFRD
jgi:hypothetical protein